MNGYCAFLEKGDWELEREMEVIVKHSKDSRFQEGSVLRGDEIPIPISLLWDQCKECGVNEEEE